MQEKDPIDEEDEGRNRTVALKELRAQLDQDFKQASGQLAAFSILGGAVPPPEGFELDSADLPYFTWFVKEGPALVGVQYLFPKALGIIYGLSVNHYILYHTILGVSKYFVDFGMQRQHTGIGGEEHLALIIPQIQQAIDNDDFDDGHIYALYLLSSMFIYRAQLEIGASYLHGLTAMIKRSEERRRESGENPTRPPLIEMALRHCMSLFNRVSRPYQRMLAIDLSLPTADLEMKWIDSIGSQSTAEYARITYRISDCMYAILRLAHRDMEIRSSPLFVQQFYEAEVAREIQEIYEAISQLQSILTLRARGPVVQSERPPVEHGPFEPTPGITDPSYGYRLVQTYLLRLALTLVQNPRIGPVSPERRYSAAELCCHYAAVEHVPSVCPNLPVLTALFCAGLTFGPNTHPNGCPPQLYRLTVEYAWIRERFERLNPRAYPNAKAIGERLDQVWIGGESSWFDLSWHGDRRFGIFGMANYIEISG